MRILLWAEFQKLKRSNIVFITMLATVLIAVIVYIGGITTLSNEQLSMDLTGWYLTTTQVWATLFVLPAMIALLGSYMICREEQEDTMKSLRLIPVDETKLTFAKLIVTFIFCVLIYLLLFFITLFIEVCVHVSHLSWALIGSFFKMYMLDGIGVFFAVSPFIAIAPYLKKSYWVSMVLTEIYSFAGLFMSMSQTLKTLYPITAVFGISGYYDTTTQSWICSLIILWICGCISGMLVKGLHHEEIG